MPIARSKLTAQGQISVPKDVRRILGLGPGSVLEWEEEEGKMVVHRAGLYTSEDIHKAIFRTTKPRTRSLKEIESGIGDFVREKYARR